MPKPALCVTTTAQQQPETVQGRGMTQWILSRNLWDFSCCCSDGSAQLRFAIDLTALLAYHIRPVVAYICSFLWGTACCKLQKVISVDRLWSAHLYLYCGWFPTLCGFSQLDPTIHKPIMAAFQTLSLDKDGIWQRITKEHYQFKFKSITSSKSKSWYSAAILKHTYSLIFAIILATSLKLTSISKVNRI